MPLASEARIVVTQSEGILVVEICRPEKKNALTASMYTALADAFDSARGSDAVRAVLIHGQSEAFTAGNDIADFLSDPPTGEDAPVFRFLHSLRSLEQPLVAAVNGIAVGIGTTLLLHCDLAYWQGMHGRRKCCCSASRSGQQRHTISAWSMKSCQMTRCCPALTKKRGV
jgi:enoyl-CoA hydratase/carnithine racemase